MQITKREFLKKLGLAAGAGLTGSALADEFVADASKLPEGSCGDPKNVWFGRHIFPLEHTLTDGPSCFLRGGKVIEPEREIPIFHETDVVVVGGGPAAVLAVRGGLAAFDQRRHGGAGRGGARPHPRRRHPCADLRRRGERGRRVR